MTHVVCAMPDARRRHGFARYAWSQVAASARAVARFGDPATYLEAHPERATLAEVRYDVWSGVLWWRCDACNAGATYCARFDDAALAAAEHNRERHPRLSRIGNIRPPRGPGGVGRR